MASIGHKSVLLKESIEILDIRKGDTFVDGTIGGGGHSLEVCRRLGSAVTIIGIDLDEEALNKTRERFKDRICDIKLFKGSFKDLEMILEKTDYEKADNILLDLGWSSDQLESSKKGFSFQNDEPLLMTLGAPNEYSVTARDLVNVLTAEELSTILRNYGEEQYASRIAHAIVAERSKKPIETSKELAEIIKEAAPRRSKIHPATKTFQAIRIAVNNELETLTKGLESAYNALAPNGRLAVISFHSLEDRIVKRAFRSHAQSGKASLVNKKPIRPSYEEIKANPRSRSAKLRALTKLTKN